MAAIRRRCRRLAAAGGNPGRSGATVATIAVAMAIAVNVTGMVESFNRASSAG
jgi:hypothetical protein